MNDKLPDYIENILEEWNTIANFSYNGYENLGRGVVAIFIDSNDTKLGYADKIYFQKNNMKKELELIEAYDPEYEMLIHFEQQNGSRTIRIRTPEGERDPKSIWFMDMVEKFINNSGDLPKNLPEWFYDDALKFIDGLEKLKKK
jgi:hypothetical protein